MDDIWMQALVAGAKSRILTCFTPRSTLRHPQMASTLHSLQFNASQVVNYAAIDRASACIRRHEPVWDAADDESTMVTLTAPQPQGDPEAPIRQHHRVAWEPGNFWRQDVMFQNDTSFAFLYTRTSAESYVKTRGFATNAPRFAWQRRGEVNPAEVERLPSIYPIHPPAFAERDWVLSTTAESCLGRDAERVRVRRRLCDGTAATSCAWPGILWPGLDEYEYARDCEYGFVLEFIGYDAGMIVAQQTLDDIRINEPLPQSTRSVPRPWNAKRSYGVNFG
jgi:hypothetical protein